MEKAVVKLLEEDLRMDSFAQEKEEYVLEAVLVAKAAGMEDSNSASNTMERIGNDSSTMSSHSTTSAAAGSSWFRTVEREGMNSSKQLKKWKDSMVKQQQQLRQVTQVTSEAMLVTTIDSSESNNNNHH